MMASPLLEVRVEALPGAVRILAAGELDMATTPELDEALAVWMQTSAAIDLDLREVTFCDSSGVRLLVRLLKHVSAERLTLRRGDAVGRVLELAGLADRFPEEVDAAGA
jgi:anti-anti-sigma factor